VSASAGLRVDPRGFAAAAILTSGLAVAAFGAAIALQVARDRLYPREVRMPGRALYVTSGAALQRMALEFDALASDIYWIRAIQYYGGERLARDRAKNYDLLYPLLDITTSLDPFFTIAYRFGAIFLSEEYPGGPGRPDQAIGLLEKGIASQPSRWQYYHDIAFVHFWHYRDYKEAATWFQRAATQPGAPNWLEPLAAAMLDAGGERASARLLWRQMLQSDEEWMRRNAVRRLHQLDALDHIDQLEAVVHRFPPPAGQPYSWEILMKRRVLPGVPLDPTGAAYAIDPATGRVTVSPGSRLQPMPTDLNQRARPR
jgi:tetratricopeptide (TPR) repeat protein